MSGIAMLVALAGGLGAVARFVLDGCITAARHRRLPVATFVINVLGSFLLGAVLGCTAVLPDAARILGTGFLGGFTTFSTACVEWVRIVRAGRPWAALGMALSMLAAGWLAAAAGIALVGGW